ncbi:MAG: hypothetical protein Tsb0019_02980 [Roseibium sp.]
MIDMIISDPFTIFKDPDLYATFPSFAMTETGLLMSFRVASVESFGEGRYEGRQQHLHPRSFLALTDLRPELCASDFRLFDPDVFAADQDPNLTRLSNGQLLMTSFSWRPVYGDEPAELAGKSFFEKTSGNRSMFWGSFAALSETDGREWSNRQYLPALPDYPDILPGRRKWLGGRQRGQALELEKGRVLVASYDLSPHRGTFCSYLHVSDDFGQSWRYGCQIAGDDEGKVGYAEPTLVRLDDGTVLALHRTFGADDRLAVAKSADAGRTWSDPELLEVRGHPYHAVPLPGGPIVILYAVRKKPGRICARLLDPHSGQLAGKEIFLREGGTAWDIGYPTGIALTGNSFLVAYYWVDSDGTRYIEGLLVGTA